MTPSCEFRCAVPEDDEELTALFNAVFRADPAQLALGTPRSVGQWRWKYVQNGVGSHSTVAVDREGAGLIGHVGGIPLRTWSRGAVRRANQSVDNMVHPSARRGLQRIGVFARMVNHWVDTYFGPEGDFLGWGFPCAENLRIGQRFSRYSVVRTVNALVLRLSGATSRGVAGIERRRVLRFGAEVDRLWERCASDVGIGVVRDARYLNWRYAEHWRDYALHEVRDAVEGGLRGLCVTRRGGFADESILLMDWLAPADDEDAARALVATAAEEADAAGLGVVTTWFPEGVEWFHRLQGLGFRVRPTDHVLVARSWDRGVTIEDLRRELYATAGDMDFL